MKYVAKVPVETADVSRGDRSARTFIKNSVSVLLVFGGLYIVLGWIAGWVAAAIPPRYERHLSFVGSEYEKHLGGHESEERVLQELLDRLVAAGEPSDLDYRVRVAEMDEPNAFALPGGTILVTTGLLELEPGEEEMAMILGHELGHFIQRDHLRSMGRGLLIGLVFGAISGGGEASGVIGIALDLAENGYSRGQEEGADEIGLALLTGAFGHAGGATGFFDRIRELDGEGRATEFFSTHPAPVSRIERIEALIRDQGHEVREVKPIDWSRTSGSGSGGEEPR